VQKVLLLVPTLDRSGAEKQLTLLATHLPRDLFDIQVVALDRGGPFESELKVHEISVTTLNKRTKLDLSALRKLRNLILDWKPDVILSWLFSANAYARLATIRISPKPRVIISERCVDLWKSSWQHGVDWLLQSRADVLMANSQSVADYYQGRGFPAGKISVIPNAVEVPPAPATTREQFCAELDLSAETRLVGFAGRLAKQKRIPDMLWAAQVLRQAVPNTCFVIIGDGPERDELQIRAEQLEVSEYCRFLGHREDAASLLHHLDVFWLASEYEGMSNSLMEAMACGKPVVVSDIPANRELVTHNENGFVADLGDSIAFSQFTQKLFEDAELASRLGEAGRQRLQSEFSVSRLIQRFQDLAAH